MSWVSCVDPRVWHWSQDHQTLLKAKYCPRIAAALCTQKNKKKLMWPWPLTYDLMPGGRTAAQYGCTGTTSLSSLLTVATKSPSTNIWTYCVCPQTLLLWVLNYLGNYLLTCAGNQGTQPARVSARRFTQIPSTSSVARGQHATHRHAVDHLVHVPRHNSTSDASLHRCSVRRSHQRSWPADEGPHSDPLTGPDLLTGPDPLTASRFELARTIAELLMYANHAINFYLYCATGQKFRRRLSQATSIPLSSIGRFWYAFFRFRTLREICNEPKTVT